MSLHPHQITAVQYAGHSAIRLSTRYGSATTARRSRSPTPMSPTPTAGADSSGEYHGAGADADAGSARSAGAAGGSGASGGSGGSSAAAISAHMCLTAWKLPIALPNWNRVRAYSAPMAAACSAPPACSAISATAD
mgnify:CR=1 FL=1